MFNLFSKKKDTKEEVMTEQEWHPSDELVETDNVDLDWHPANELVEPETIIEDTVEDVVNEETVTESVPEYSLDSLMYDPAVLGWGSVEEQEALFSALMLYYQPGQSVLDVGCGRSDLYDFINRVYQSEFTYKGIDYNPNILEVAKQKYPGVNVENIDALSLDADPEFDWVYASGLFNLADHQDMMTYLISVVDSMYNKAKLGIAFNVMTLIPDGVTDEERSQLVQWEPGSLMSYFVTKYNKVVCRTDYMLGDATFLIIK